MIVLGTPIAKAADIVTVVDSNVVNVNGGIFRIYGYDAPSHQNGRCPAEKAEARKMISLLKDTLHRHPPTSIARFGDQTVRIFIGGKDLAELMIEKGYGQRSQPLDGWCSWLRAQTYRAH
jgi:endonuclease YncB( thermonuclease family)